MQTDVYEKLQDWIVTTFRALPGVKSPELMDILKFQYSPEEAWLAIEMGPNGGKMDELIAKTGKTREELEALIRSMEKKGTVYSEPGKDDPVYKPIGMEMLGIIETVSWGDNSTPFKKKLNELWYKFKPIYVNEGVSAIGKHSVAYCHVSALPPDAVPEENLFELIKAAHQPGGYIAVSPCPCRVIERHGEDGDVCDHILESCLTFGDLAHWAAENNWGRRITLDECIEIIKKCNEKGQINIGAPGVIVCNCCKHACLSLYAMKLGKDHVFLPNHFHSVADPETCLSCGTCVERCPVGAVQLDETAVVDTTRCIGCGACASGCEAKSIKIVRKSEEDIARVDAKIMEGTARLTTVTTPNWKLFDI